MGQYDESSAMAVKMFVKYIKDRLDELNISVNKLSDMIGMPASTLHDNLSYNSKMSLFTFFKICGALDLNPYIQPKEKDDNEKTYLHFN